MKGAYFLVVEHCTAGDWHLYGADGEDKGFHPLDLGKFLEIPCTVFFRSRFKVRYQSRSMYVRIWESTNEEERAKSSSLA